MTRGFTPAPPDSHDDEGNAVNSSTRIDDARKAQEAADAATLLREVQEAGPYDHATES